MEISFTLNRDPITIDVPSKIVLLDIFRDMLGLTGTKAGCEIGSCGACTVIVDGAAQNSCTFVANRLEGTTVFTIEGLSASDGMPNDLQRSFLEHGAVQCGYCIPGIIMAGESLLVNNPLPSRQEIRKALAGNLCRCTGYVQIIDAIEETARQRARTQEAT